jgi:hypothetical protein
VAGNPAGRTAAAILVLTTLVAPEVRWLGNGRRALAWAL